MSLGEEESGLLALMDGSRTVRELRRRGPLSPLDTDRFLYALLCSQMVELRTERRTGPPPAPRLQGRGGAGRRETSPWDDDEEVLELEDEVPGDDDEGHLRERLLGALAAMRRMDYFELLGLRHDAPPDAVRSAAVELLREYRVRRPGQLGRGGDGGPPDRRAGRQGARHPGRPGVPRPVPGGAPGRRREARGGRGGRPHARGGERVPAGRAAPGGGGCRGGARGVQRGRAAAARGRRVPGAPGLDDPRPGPRRTPSRVGRR